MIGYDPHKIRDEEYRARFARKLEEIRAVRARHTYLAYAVNRNLLEELRSIYEENLRAYEEHYLHNLARLKALRQRLEEMRAELHPERYESLAVGLDAIEEKLAAEDYTQNALAQPLLVQAGKELEAAVERFRNWNTSLAAYRMRLKEILDQVWAEDYQILKAEYQRLKTQGSEAQPGIDEAALTDAVQRRKDDIERLRSAAQGFGKILRDLRVLEGRYASRAEYEALEKMLRIAKRRRRIWQYAASVVLLGSVILLAVLAPGWYREYRDRQAWEQAREMNTYAAYETYLRQYPEGHFHDAAQQAVYNLDAGVIPELTDAQGRSFRYEGDLLFGQPNGSGTAIFTDSSQYRGAWEQGYFHGAGVLLSADGSRYEGDWRAGIRAGEGIQLFANGARYEGAWRDDQPWGEGHYYYQDGGEYEGEFRAGKRHGTGRWQGPEGESYEGSWRSGAMDGWGVYVYPDSSRYEGEWQAGNRHGTGKQQWADGSVYTGSWTDGRRHGKGSMRWGEGGSYVGYWSEGRIRGEGIYTDRFRAEYRGVWEQDSTGISFFDEEGNLLKKGRFEQGLFTGGD